MSTVNALATIGQLFGEPTRASMLIALLDGRALTAGELAYVAGVTPQTASGHLAALLGGDVLAVAQQGRHRYYRIASPEIADMLERMLSFAELKNMQKQVKAVRTGPKDLALRIARTCYDHMAGAIAVGIVDRLVERGHVGITTEAAFLSKDGINFLNDLGIDLQASGQEPILCKPCMDWSERRLHLGGHAGRSIYRSFADRGWVRNQPGSRALIITPKGKLALERHFGFSASTVTLQQADKQGAWK